MQQAHTPLPYTMVESKQHKRQKTENHDEGVEELWWPSLVSDFVVGYLEYQPLPVTKIVPVAKQLKIMKLSSSY